MSKLPQLVSSVFLATAISATSLVSFATAQTKTLSGNWTMAFGGRSAKMKIVQNGNNLSGSISGPMGEMPLKGKISNNREVSFGVDTPMGGGSAKFEGVLDGTSMKGTANVPRLGKTNWTATR
jgi:hypothetical protein